MENNNLSIPSEEWTEVEVELNCRASRLDNGSGERSARIRMYLKLFI